jgi:uncharacterized protein
MIALVQDRLAELETACQRYAVRRLALFGSAASGPFVPETSDLDFLVEFTPLPPIQRASATSGCCWTWSKCSGDLLIWST